MSPDAGPAATDEVRRRNTALVMRLLRDSGALSRADLARRSGLAKATIGTIVSQLERAGAVASGETASTGRGRPSTPIVLAGRSLAGLGVEIIGNTPEEFGNVIRTDIVKWAKVVKESGAKAD